jgi:uncharacterized Zn-binding protein involved in type VI secretion
MTAKVIVAGDTETWTDCPPPHNGGGTGTITNTLNNVLRISGKYAIVKGQPYKGPDGCDGTAGTSGTGSTVLWVNGVPVVLEGDAGTDGCHALLGARSGQQDFVRAD